MRNRRRVDPDRFARWLEEAEFSPHPSRRGEYLRNWCPFCGSGRAWRVMANVSGVVNCFGCGHGYGAIKFVAENDSVSFAQAAQLIAEDVVPDLDAPFETLIAKEIKTPDFTPLAIPAVRFDLDFHRHQQPWMLEALAALNQRGFDALTCAAYGIGFGLADRWANRVVLPVWEPAGTAWYLAWAQGWDWTRTSKIKYQSPPRGVGRRRAELLYRGAEIRDVTEPVVVCEGIFNAWAAQQVGYVATATFGKSVAPYQIECLLALRTDQLILAFDADARDMMLRIGRVLLERGKRVQLVEYPDARDLNDLDLATRGEVLRCARQIETVG